MTLDQELHQKIVLVMSGGIDSTTLLHYLVSEGYEVYPVTFNYGQRHKKEQAFALFNVTRMHMAKFNIKRYHVIDISDIQKLLKSALTDSDIEVPKVPETAEHYETLKVTVVPNRNMIFLAIAAGYANSIGAHKIAYAAHASDKGVYPDCRPEFVADLEGTLQLALDDPEFEVLAPFIEIPKSEIIKIGHRLGVDYMNTWTCYEGGENHCGTCSSCRERKRAFKEAGVEDPTEYEVC